MVVLQLERVGKEGKASLSESVNEGPYVFLQDRQIGAGDEDNVCPNEKCDVRVFRGPVDPRRAPFNSKVLAHLLNDVIDLYAPSAGCKRGRSKWGRSF